MTDDGEEQECDHPAQKIRWTQSKAWVAEAKNDELKKLFGTLEWTAPANREEVRSLPTGPEQECTFDIDVRLAPIDLMFDALPVQTVWKP